MNPFEDRIPEEQDPEYEELITLLQKVNHNPSLVNPTRRARILSRTRMRLMQKASDITLDDEIAPEETLLPYIVPNEHKPQVHKPQRKRRLVYLLNNLVAVLVIVSLIASILILRSSLLGRSGGSPTLTISSNAASPGSTVKVMLKHFSPSTIIVMTHDIHEPITFNGGSSIRTDAAGNASFSMLIGDSWGPGFHLIQAEDVNSRSTASANLQITGEGISEPAHLVIDPRPLVMGTDYAGTNTIRSFTLANSGNGSISWSASSDAPWLLVSPSQGTFSNQQVISVAVQRLGLKPGEYRGHLIISSNVSPAQHIEIDMSVQAIPANAGSVLAITPALLSFTAVDKQPDPGPQGLSISNPGSQSLRWNLSSVALSPIRGFTCNWLSASPSSGSIDPGASQTLMVSIQSQCLLPGTYSGTFTFTAAGALDSTQSIAVSVVVQPHCGLVTSTGFLAFTVVAGQTTLANQSLSLNGTQDCSNNLISWKAFSTAPWISITPGSGQVQGGNSYVVTASVNAAGLISRQKPYYAYLTFTFGQSSLTVLAQLTVQAAQSTSPILSASPLNLNFSNIEGQPDPTGQVVSVTNTGHTPLSWHVAALPSSLLTWLTATPPGGIVAPGQSEQVTVKVLTSQLTPGNYVGQVTLNGMDARGNIAPGSPQTIAVNLTIQPPCTLSQPSSSALSFSAVQGASTPTSQTVLLTGIGSCVWPLTWITTVSPAASWLTQTAGGTITGNDQSGSVGVTVNTTGLIPGTYSTTVTISASDSNNVTVQGGIQTFMVTLTVTGLTVSGSVLACPVANCTTPIALAGVTVTITSGSTTVATTTADSSGNYSFSNIPAGSYTITAAGYDSSSTHYTGSLPLALSGNTSNLTLNVLPG